MNKRQSWNVITLFCIMIFGFTLATILVPSRDYSETENRTLSQMPKVNAADLLSGDFEEDYEAYLKDQFVLRDKWIGLKTKVERLLFKQDSKDIYFAEDDYLIEKHTGSFTGRQASANLANLKNFVDNYQEQFKGHMTAMVIPNAVSILREKLPKFASPYDENVYLGKMKAILPEEVWFDTASILEAHKYEDIYYRTDHHWKTLGAFYVYQAWAEKQGLTVPQEEDYEIRTVTEEFQGTIQSKLGIDTRKDSIQLYIPKEDPLYIVQKEGSEEISYSVYNESYLDTKDKYAVFFGGNSALIHIKTRVNNTNKILVIKDSYANCFVPFLLTDYAEIDLLDIRYYNQKISDLIAENNYTDILFLYNAAGFAEETALGRLIF